jgi:hypothetical protein
MVQANPALTPNLVKAILQYTAEHQSRYDDLSQGGGFLNARGAVQAARSFVAGGNPAPADGIGSADPTPWNKHINWGNHRIGGGVLRPDANAWRLNVTWGAASTDEGDAIVWGTVCKTADQCAGSIRGSSVAEDNIVWGTSCASRTCDDIVWGASAEDNIVWGTACGGADCSSVVWGATCAQGECSNVVWGPSNEANIVWGTNAGDEDIIAWGNGADVAGTKGLVPSAAPSRGPGRP